MALNVRQNILIGNQWRITDCFWKYKNNTNSLCQEAYHDNKVMDELKREEHRQQL